MRKIKFRAWDIPNKEMRYSDKHDGEFYLNARGVFYEYMFLVGGQRYRVYASMQYTGLEDKNGVSIYEGDILDSAIHGTTIKVVYRCGSFCWESKEEYDCLCELPPLSFEVVGNVYENPELLTKGETK